MAKLLVDSPDFVPAPRRRALDRPCRRSGRCWRRWVGFRLICIATAAGFAGPARAEPIDEMLALFGTAWGHSVDQVAVEARPKPRRLERPIDFGPLAAPLVIADFHMLESRFFVWFQFPRDGGGLRQILVQRRRADGERLALDKLASNLQERLGDPAGHCPVDPRAAVRREASRWTTATATLHLQLLDYRVPGLVTEGEPLTEDPTVPWYQRQSLDVAALPVRILMRLTPPGDEEPPCPAAPAAPRQKKAPK